MFVALRLSASLLTQLPWGTLQEEYELCIRVGIDENLLSVALHLSENSSPGFIIDLYHVL